jgi:hypothetical protein
VGFIKDAKRNMVREEAKRAIDEGRTVYAPRLNTPATHGHLSGSIPGWAEMIEEIETAGWVMTNWSVAAAGACPVRLDLCLQQLTLDDIALTTR